MPTMQQQLAKGKGPLVVGPAEARVILGGISRQRFHQLSKHPDFPPARELEIGRVYDRYAMEAFQRERTSAGKEGMAKAVKFYLNRRNVAQTARHVGVTTTTVRRWLRELDIPLPLDAANGRGD